jgi:two-component system CheB/CheR fusion protein
MNNLLAGTGVATLFVDKKLRITRFTPDTTEVINLIRTDVGRPVAHLASNLVDYDSLVEDAQRVLDTLVPDEAEVKTRSGSWFLMRLHPYRTVDNVIEGVVITFVDITKLKRAEEALRLAHAFAENIISTVRGPLVVLDDRFRVVTANPAFFRHFGGTVEDTVGRGLFELGRGRWDIPGLRRRLEEILPKGTAFEDYKVTQDVDGGGPRTVMLNARRVLTTTGGPEMILLAFEAPMGWGEGGSGPSGGNTMDTEP